jgi:transposase-like protein
MDSGASALAPLLDGSTAGELIPELVRHGLQQLIKLEVAAVLGAERYERSEDRLGHRNGYRPRLPTTQVGDIDLQIPKLRSGSFLPSILEPRRRVDQALYAVVMEAYVAGVSTRKVDALVAALGSQSPPLPAKLTPLHFDHQGGLMEQSYASLQRSRQG